MKIKTDISKTGKLVTITVSGDFNFENRTDFIDACKNVPEETRVYEVDLSQVSQIDSAALGALLVLKNYSGINNADVRIVNSSCKVDEYVRAVFNKDVISWFTPDQRKK